MSCASCGAVEQRGRFCVGCGRILPRTAPSGSDTPRRVSPAARPYLTDDMTQPVLRFRQAVVTPRVPVRERTAPSEIPA